MTNACAHYWIPNSGRGGEPVFKRNRQLATEPVMHVRCARCGARSWFTREAWHAIPAVLPPDDVATADA